VVFKAKAVEGPWHRQQSHADINCRNSTAEICGGYGLRDGNYDDIVRASTTAARCLLLLLLLLPLLAASVGARYSTVDLVQALQCVYVCLT
jgi:hypothetical protein